MIGNPYPEPVVFRHDRNESQGEIFRAEPGVLALNRGQAVTLHHEGEQGGVVFIPYPDIFEEKGYVHPLVKTPEGFRLVLHVREDAPRGKGEFDYAVFSHDLKRFAVGNAPPRMILEP